MENRKEQIHPTEALTVGQFIAELQACKSDHRLRFADGLTYDRLIQRDEETVEVFFD